MNLPIGRSVVATAIVTVTVAGCGSPLPSLPSANPVSTPSLTMETDAVPVVNNGWKVDVVSNAPMPLIVSITTDVGGGAWVVMPGESRVLLNSPRPPGEGNGTIEIIKGEQNCALVGTSLAPQTSFTVLLGERHPDNFLTIVPGAEIAGPPDLTYFGGCSG